MKVMDIEEKPVERERLCWFHWQNLNDKRDGRQGLAVRNGRCWWHFRERRVVRIEWSFLTPRCGFGIDFDDDGITAFLQVPLLFSFFLTLAGRWNILKSFSWAMGRSSAIQVHNGAVWIKPWSREGEWRSTDPWWIRGVNFSINPFEWKHQQHLVKCHDGSWEPYVGCWEDEKTPDRRKVYTSPYRYVLNDGTIQDRIATYHVERWTRRPRCLRWTSLFEKSRTSIDVSFNDEVGERTGSWKGGTVGCSFELRKGEAPFAALRRMEATRTF